MLLRIIEREFAAGVGEDDHIVVGEVGCVDQIEIIDVVDAIDAEALALIGDVLDGIASGDDRCVIETGSGRDKQNAFGWIACCERKVETLRSIVWTRRDLRRVFE